MEGNSPTVREAVWEWYTSVVKTRLHNDSQELIVFTRWHEDDLIGRLEAKETVIELTSLDQVDSSFDGWYKLNFDAIKESPSTPIDPREYGTPLWPSRHGLKLLSEKRVLDRHSFDCMYQGRPRSKEGVLYADFKTYRQSDKPEIVRKHNYTDTADQGDDNLCSVCYEVGADGNIYIVDVVYTQQGMEITEPAVADMLIRNDTRTAYIESNNGGRGFARAVAKIALKTNVEWFHQGQSKEARILTNAATVQKFIFFPEDWSIRWSKLYADIVGYKRMCRANRWHDAPDVLTGIVEKEIATPKAAGVRTATFKAPSKR